MIDIYLRSGLANRMRVIASCINLQKNFEHPFHYFWQESEELQASFDKLFDPIPGVIIDPANQYFRGAGIKYIRYFLIRWYGLMRYDKVMTDEGFMHLYNHNQEKLLQILKIPNQKILLRLCCDFGNNRENYKLFKPARQIQHQIDAISQQFDANTWGIHIRQTDNTMSVKHSPVHLFYQKMDKRIEEVPESTFFVSTDDQKIEAEIKQKYKGHIITIPNKIFNRNNTEGMQQAVMDMFLLSKTSRIIGSYYSSFNVAAAKIGSVTLDVVKSDNN